MDKNRMRYEVDQNRGFGKKKMDMNKKRIVVMEE